MNLLENKKRIEFFEDINPISFRRHQYDYILDFVENAINFISKQNGNYLEVTKRSYQNRVNYTGVYNSKYSKIEFEIKNKLDNSQKIFTTFFIPTLIENNHFYLNGKYYTPALYLIDFPVTIKKKSIMISSLFNSITIYTKDDIVIFTRRNFRLDSFIQLFVDYDNELYQNYIKKNKLNHEEWSKENLIELYSGKFSVNKDIEEIKNKIEKLFFDDYTYELYNSCYDLEEVNLKNIILLSFKKFEEGEQSFNNLNNKRLVFVEYILRPFLIKVSNLATEIAKGINKDQMKVDELLITKYFLTSVDLNNPTGKTTIGLSGNYIYDSKNLYSCILQPKATFITPGMNTPPGEVKHLHQSHYGRLCPITVSSQHPGETVSIVPNVELNSFGCFE